MQPTIRLASIYKNKENLITQKVYIRGYDYMIDIAVTEISDGIDEEIFLRLYRCISNYKKEKISKYRFVEDRNRCLIGDLLARYTICRKYKLPLEVMEFYEDSFGKPKAANYKDIHFNISHSGNWVVCAVDYMPVGIDVELIKPIHIGIAKRFYSQEEYIKLLILNEEERIEFFYKLWTLKESYIKAVGRGLSIDISSCSFDIKTGQINLNSNYKQRKFYFKLERIDKQHFLSVCACNEKFGSITPVNIEQIVSFYK